MVLWNELLERNWDMVPRLLHCLRPYSTLSNTFMCFRGSHVVCEWTWDLAKKQDNAVQECNKVLWDASRCENHVSTNVAEMRTDVATVCHREVVARRRKDMERMRCNHLWEWKLQVRNLDCIIWAAPHFFRIFAPHLSHFSATPCSHLGVFSHFRTTFLRISACRFRFHQLLVEMSPSKQMMFHGFRTNNSDRNR